MSVGAVILAAGGARRFGAAKQLAPLRGRPLLQHALDAALAVETLDHIVLVLGAQAEAIISGGIQTGRARIARSTHWADGQAASLKAGVAALPARTTSALILLGDQPGVTGPLIERVLRAHAEPDTIPAATRATYAGRPGHPVVLGPQLLALVPTLRGDTGARELLTAHDVREVEAGDLGSASDVDTPADLAALAAGKPAEP